MISPDELRKCAICVYLAAEAGPAEDIASHLNQAADTITACELELEDVKAKLAAAEQREAVSLELLKSIRGYVPNEPPINLYDSITAFLSNAPGSEWVGVEKQYLADAIIVLRQRASDEDFLIMRLEKCFEAALSQKGGRDGE